MYCVKAWEKFQHYSDRNPPWVKLHKNLLDDFDFQSLPVASRALAPMLWLLASEHENPRSGFINGPGNKIAFRLHMSVSDFDAAINPLIDGGFIILASTPLAECLQVATPETEDRVRDREQRHKPRGGFNGKQKSFVEEGNRLAEKYRTQAEAVTLDTERQS